MPNFHPMLVHFPIGLLTIYALLECVRLKRVLQLPYWFYVKAVFVMVGSLASMPTFLSGKLIEPLFQNQGEVSALVLRHSQWALITMVLFLVIAIAYLFGWIKRTGKGVTPGFIRTGIRLSDAVLETAVVPVLALGGLVSITITGALGGSIVYGPGVDPFASAIYRVFGPK